MGIRTTRSHRYRYSPPFPWRGPQPTVSAFRVREMTTLRAGQQTIVVAAGEWLLETRDGTQETMSDATFRKWYAPVNAGAAAALDTSRPRRPQRSARRRPRKAAVKGQGALGL